MPIDRLLGDGKFGPEEVEILRRAFDRALRLLHLVDRGDPLAELVARKIIEIGATDVRDPAEIAKIAVSQLRIR